MEEFARLSSENANLRAEMENLKVATAPRLILINRAGEPISGEIKEERVLKIYTSGLLSLDAMFRQSYAHKYLALNILQILELGVQNLGHSLVEHITIDLSLKPIVGFYCGYGGRKLLEDGGRLSNSTIVSEYQYKFPDEIRLIEADHVSIRFRIAQVSAGGTEFVPDLFVLGAIDGQRACFELDYKCAGSSGPPATGSARYEITFTGTVEAPPEEADRALLKLQNSNGIIIIEKMLFHD
jgi:hypothetical protein